MATKIKDKAVKILASQAADDFLGQYHTIKDSHIRKIKETFGWEAKLWK